MNASVGKWLSIFLLSAGAVGHCAFAATAGEVLVGGQLPDAAMRGLSGSDAHLGDFRGKPLLINVWASWCGPCRQEMTSLQRLASRYDGKEFNVIGVSTDDDREAAVVFLRRSGTRFRQYIDQRLQLENLLGADRLPLTVLVAPDGRVIKKIAGARAWDSPESINLIVHAFRIVSSPANHQ